MRACRRCRNGGRRGAVQSVRIQLVVSQQVRLRHKIIRRRLRFVFFLSYLVGGVLYFVALLQSCAADKIPCNGIAVCRVFLLRRKHGCDRNLLVRLGHTVCHSRHLGGNYRIYVFRFVQLLSALRLSDDTRKFLRHKTQFSYYNRGVFAQNGNVFCNLAPVN